MMKAAAQHYHHASSSSSSSFPSFSAEESLFTRKGIGIGFIRVKLSDSNAKRANLSARKKERIMLRNCDDLGGGEKMYRFSEFLCHPSGIEAMLNTKALQNFQSLDSNMYRCTLPQIQFLNFEIAPVLDLQVIPTKEDCIVEMLSCKFEGSEVLERQNDRFSASMRNHITWETVESEPFLEVDVKLNVTLELFFFIKLHTQPTKKKNQIPHADPKLHHSSSTSPPSPHHHHDGGEENNSGGHQFSKAHRRDEQIASSSSQSSPTNRARSKRKEKKYLVSGEDE